MELNLRNRSPEDELVEQEPIKRSKIEKLALQHYQMYLMLLEQQRRKKLMARHHPEPEYRVDDDLAYSFDDASQAFHMACAEGKLQRVRNFVEDSERPRGALQFGLEEAAHAFQLNVVRYLMQEHDVGLHTGVFEHLERRASSPTNNIFDRNDPRMLDLLRIFLDNGWSPNQT